MQKIILIAVAILVQGITSCKNINKKISGNDKTFNPFSENSGNDNNDIIAFNNKIVELDKSHSDYIKKLNDGLNGMNTYVKSALANPQANIMKPIFIPMVMIGGYNEIKAPNTLGSNYQKQADSIKATFTEIKALQKQLETYKDGEDWKDDKGKKLEELTEQAHKLFATHQNQVDALFKELTPLADKAEAEILKDHPLQKQILQSREVLNLVRKIVDDSYEINDPAAYQTLFAQQYESLEKLYNRNMDTKIPSSEKTKESPYNSFNSSVNDFLSKMRVVKRSLSDNDKKLDDNLDAMERESNFVLSRYNTFVK